MAAYARNDIQAYSNPRGCGQCHTRPTGPDGFPAKTFRIDCDPCEAQIFGGHRRVKKSTLTGGPLEYEISHDPCWSRSIDAIPLTPDEQRAKEAYENRGTLERDQLTLSLLSRMAGESTPDLLSQGITGAWSYNSPLASSRPCRNGHDVPFSSQFCGSCGVGMNEKPAFLDAPVDPGFQGEIPDYEDAPVSQMRRLCEERGLRFDGDHAALVQRLKSDDKTRLGVKEVSR